MSCTRYEPGEIILVNILEDAVFFTNGHDGKWRPGVLVDELPGGGWRVMGLTTLPAYANGTPRTPVTMALPGHWNRKRSYLWGPRLPFIPRTDIKDHIGWADDDLVDSIAEVTGRSAWELEPLRPHARRDRRRNRVAA